MLTRSRTSRGPGAFAPSIAGLIGLSVALAAVAGGLSGCGRNDDSRESKGLALVTAAQFDPLLLDLLRRSDPQGAVLLAFWSDAEPIPKEFAALADRWRRYGLVTLAVLVEEGAGAGAEGDARSRSGRGPRPPSPLRGIRFSGTLAEMEAIVRSSARPPAVLLLSPEGKNLWSSPGFGDLDGLEAVLQLHLGEPSVADAAIIPAGLCAARASITQAPIR